MNIQKIISYLIKLIWAITFMLILFIDRENKVMVLITIVLLLIITTITILRSINSRNEWIEGCNRRKN